MYSTKYKVQRMTKKVLRMDLNFTFALFTRPQISLQLEVKSEPQFEVAQIYTRNLRMNLVYLGPN